MLAQQSEGKADSTLGARPTCLKAEAKVPVERRNLRKVARAVELEKEPWFKKGNKRERKVCPSRKKKQASQAFLVHLPCTCCSINV